MTRYKKDLESLIGNGTKLYYGLLYELRDELKSEFDQLPKETQKLLDDCLYTQQNVGPKTKGSSLELNGNNDLRE